MPMVLLSTHLSFPNLSSFSLRLLMNPIRFFQLFLCCLVAFPSIAATDMRLNVLDEYVRKADDDDNYSWSVHSETETDGVRNVIVDMVSQHWLTEEDVDRPEWRHWLIITIPTKVTSEVGLLYISGGSNNGNIPGPNETMMRVASATNTVVAELKTIPNQPLVYVSDEFQKPRYEDDLIGYAWDKYLETADPRWLPRGPMVKGAVRAMDTISTFTSSSDELFDTPISRFVVAGGSKRGWTAWLTAAMDDRVVAVAPIVIDVVNIKPSMQHHFAAYGFWAPSIGNYVEHGIMTQWQNPRLDDIYELVDPYYYLDRLTMPKLVLNASGDQFFLPDSSQFYWDALKGPKYLRYVPNANHSLGGTNGNETLIAFHALMAHNQAMPEYDWEVGENGEIAVSASTPPLEVHLWQATNPVARDFRVETIGKAYTSTQLSPDDDGKYVGSVVEPESGWTAYFVELTWDVGLPVPLRLSTEVKVTPDTLPFEGKNPSLANSVSLICTLPSVEEIPAFVDVIENIEDTSFAKEGIQTQAWRQKVYVNWTPADIFNRGFFEVAALLEQSGCVERSYQFESGPDITVPPLNPE